VTFNQESTATIQPGQFLVSDPVGLTVRSGQDIATSVYVSGPAVPAGHDYDRVTHFQTPEGSGNHTSDVGGAAFTMTRSSTVLASAIDVLAADQANGTAVAIGGSVVDGFQSTLDGYDNFPDQLAQRVASELPAANRMPVVNAGIAGTTAAAVCSNPLFGPSAQERLDRDVLSLAHVTHALVWAGTNDLAGGCTGDQIIAAYTDIANRLHVTGIKVLISTITPRSSYTAAQNLYRAQVNAWVREGNNCTSHCDNSLDFDAVLRDPNQPNQIAPVLDSGDHIHPNPTGYGLVAQSVNLQQLVD